MDRICIYIDGSNLYHGLREYYKRTNIDLGKLTDRLVGPDRKLIRAYYYNAPVRGGQGTPRAKNQQRFFEGLRRIPYFDVRLGRLEPRGTTYVEKGVDIALAIDMYSMAVKDIYDTAVLVSCDADFAKAVDAVRDTGKHVEVACFAKAYHLQGVADRVVRLDQLDMSSLWLSK